MEDLELGPDVKLPDIEVPISHEQPKTTLDSLVQIKKEFESKIQEAKEKNDSSKLRRYQRQSKQFEDAINACRQGKVFNYSELIVPPGFCQIPLNNGKPVISVEAPKPAPRAPQPAKIEKYDNVPMEEPDEDDIINQLEQEIGDDFGDDSDEDSRNFQKQINAAKNLVPAHLKHMIPKEEDLELPDSMLEDKLSKLVIPEPKNKISPKSPQNVQPPKHGNQPTVSPNKRAQTRELSILAERQRLFKEAALKAKQEGNVNVALAYLRNAKGIENMITAAENGLPLDMSNLPVPPQMLENKKMLSPSGGKSFSSTVSNSFVVIDEEPISGDRQAIYKRLFEVLSKQIKIATENYENFNKMGDLCNATKFKKVAQESIQDLEALRNADRLNEPVPLYHYEKRTFEKVDCNGDLTDNELELEIIRAINISLPKEIKADSLNTYAKFDFPYPPEQEQTDKTKVQNSCNPEYNQKFKLQIQRKQQKFIRLMGRKDLKIEIYAKMGFLRSDKLIANCSIKLQSFENTSTIHDIFELLEGRRQSGGKIEVRLRIREPLLHKKVQLEEYRWLIIDKFTSNNIVSL